MFQRYRVWIFLVGLAVLVASVLVPAPEGLGPQGLRCLGVFTTCVLFWVTSVLPLAVTSLAVLALLPLLGVLGPDESFALFGNRAVFFILGALVLVDGAGYDIPGCQFSQLMEFIHEAGAVGQLQVRAFAAECFSNQE